MPVARWHGDVAASQKKKLLAQPAGVLIITPESLEALFVLQGPKVRSLFERLDHVVDRRAARLHRLRARAAAPVAAPPGRAGRPPAGAPGRALGDARRPFPRLRVPPSGKRRGRAPDRLAGNRPGAEGPGARLPCRPALSSLRLGSRRWRPPARRRLWRRPSTGDDLEISLHLFAKLRGGHHLIFANSRTTVELYADLLRRHCEVHGIPNEFWPHHGSLSRDLREETEARDQGSRAAGQRGLHDDAGAGDRRRRDRERGPDRAAALGRQPPPAAGALGASGRSRGAARLHSGRRDRRAHSAAAQAALAAGAGDRRRPAARRGLVRAAGRRGPPSVHPRPAGPLLDRAARRRPGRSALAGALPRGCVSRGRFGALRRAPAQPRRATS